MKGPGRLDKRSKQGTGTANTKPDLFYLSVRTEGGRGVFAGTRPCSVLCGQETREEAGAEGKMRLPLAWEEGLSVCLEAGEGLLLGLTD